MKRTPKLTRLELAQLSQPRRAPIPPPRIEQSKKAYSRKGRNKVDAN